MKLREYFKSGDAWVWLNAGTVTISLIMVVGILGLIAVRGLGHFWPADVMQAMHTEMDGSRKPVIGEIYDEKIDTAQRLREAGIDIPGNVETVTRFSLKVGNRDLGGADFKWVFEDRLSTITYPADIVALERYEWGHFYGRLKDVRQAGEVVASGEQAWTALQQRIGRADELRLQATALEKGDVGRINYDLEQLRLEEKRLELRHALTDADRERIAAAKAVHEKAYEGVRLRLEKLVTDAGRDSAVFVAADGTEKEITLDKIVTAYKPNDMNGFSKLATYFHNLWMFLSGDPREANTEGGVFPAIFGTVLMVLMMTVLVTPLGVIAAIYLREYANQGVITQTVRIAVNNLAGCAFHCLWRIRPGLLCLLCGRFHGPDFLSGSRAVAGVWYAGPALGLHHAGLADPAGGDRGDRRRFGPHSRVRSRKALWRWAPPRPKPCGAWCCRWRRPPS
jgi:phosphate transport system permease protein